MTQDPQERERRASLLYGVEALVLGLFVLVLYFSRGDDSWPPIMLAIASLAFSAFMLARAFRT
jgi:hypothetical protein